jgi:hypothetical protein
VLLLEASSWDKVASLEGKHSILVWKGSTAFSYGREVCPSIWYSQHSYDMVLVIFSAGSRNKSKCGGKVTTTQA